MSEGAIRIAMWSGPRNISTAMMRAWSSRPDTAVCDEPLYARYLARTGAVHPGRDRVIAEHETDLQAVLSWLLGPVPGSKRIFYQKHMAHHLLEGDDLAWIGRLRNALLIRDPREMILSFTRVVSSPTPGDLGLPQQAALFERVLDETGTAPPVVEARDVMDVPRGTLSALCAQLEVPFDEAMLSWEAGPRETDGVWADHWYDAVQRSTRFEPHRPRQGDVPRHLRRVLDECLAIYEHLSRFKLTPNGSDV